MGDRQVADMHADPVAEIIVRFLGPDGRDKVQQG
jgi:hypothetical protein